MRTEMRRLRQGLTLADRRGRSRRIAGQLWKLDVFVQARRVLFYAARGSEVETLPLIERWIQGGRKPILPRVEGEAMALVEVEDLTDLVPGYRGLLEPRPDRGREVHWEKVEVALVPGLAFDLQGNRLGQGGGHYDRALARTGARSLKIGLAFDFQVVERLPADAHDVPVDLIVTETRAIEAAKAKKGPTTGPVRR
ncbi:MAG: 5-formyltetrahydrofolate cyclo-ligase [Candidatus Methylomirabilales bacterium]